jgi:hypothetical protein
MVGIAQLAQVDPHDARSDRPDSHSPSPRFAVAGLGVQSAGAAKPLKGPRPGPWKIIAAANAPHGLEVRGGLIGSFRVTKHSTVVGFHLSFTEEGESIECAGGEGEEDSPRKSGTLKFAPGASAPIIRDDGAWFVTVDTGTIGGGSLQGAEVDLISPNGSFHGLIDATLVTRKGERRRSRLGRGRVRRRLRRQAGLKPVDRRISQLSPTGFHGGFFSGSTSRASVGVGARRSCARVPSIGSGEPAAAQTSAADELCCTSMRWAALAAIAATLAATSTAVAVPVASATTTAKKHHAASAKLPRCSSIVPLGAIRGATGLGGTELSSTETFSESRGFFWEVNEAGKGRLPGSECIYDDLTPETSYTQVVYDSPDASDDYVTVGYGESEKDWRAFEAALKNAGGGSPPLVSNDIPTQGLNGEAPVSALSLGHGSQAFLETGDLIAAGDAPEEQGPVPKFPTIYYIVTVKTKRNDVLQVGLYGATLTAAQKLVENVLTGDPKF